MPLGRLRVSIGSGPVEGGLDVGVPQRDLIVFARQVVVPEVFKVLILVSQVSYQNRETINVP